MPPSYKIGEHSLNYVDEIKYPGVVMQSNLKINRHIASKVNSAKKVLRCIKYALKNDAPQPAKLLAYSSLCRPIPEYADALWDPADAASIQKLEAVSTKQTNHIFHEHQRVTLHHRGPDSSWTT